MNKVILHDDGAVTVMAPGFSAEAARISLQARGVGCRVVELADLKDRPERIAAARADAMTRLRRWRDATLDEMDGWDALYVLAGRHLAYADWDAFEVEKQRLRDLPATVETRGDLDALDADELDAYAPPAWPAPRGKDA